MALYTEQSYDDVANFLANNDLERRQKLALAKYGAQKAKIDSQYQTNGTGLSGLLSSLTKDAKAVGNTAGTTLAAVYSPFRSIGQELTQKNNLAEGNKAKDNIAKKYGYESWEQVKESGEGPDEMWEELQKAAKKTSQSVSQAAQGYKNDIAVKQINNTKQSQYGADALRTEALLANALGLGATPAGAAFSGALSGVADSLEKADGTLVDLQADLSGGKIKSSVNSYLDAGDVAKNALIGGAAGLAAGGIGSKLGNATSGIGNKLLNNKLVTSGVGRGAIGGATAGAVSGGLGAAFEGGDVLGSALQGAGTGAITGGISGGATSLAKKGATSLTDALGVTDNINALKQKYTYDPTEAKAARVEKKLQRQAEKVAEKAAQKTTQDTAYDSSDLMYGESDLGNRTKRGMVADTLSRVGDTLEGAQSNITRSAARKLGIERTGKTIENVRKKTGITSLDTQADFAKELTGGEKSLMDSVQRRALSATEDGKPIRVDTTDVARDVDSIVEKYASGTAFESETAKRKWAQNIKNDISNGATDVITKANKMKSSAAELRNKGVTNPTEGDAAKAKILQEVANRLDEKSYSAIPQSNVEDMFDVTISEMRGRAQQAKANGNTTIAKAYNKAADALNNQPRTVQAYRNFKKDFVDVSKIDTLTGQAENGAAFQAGSSTTAGLKRFANRLLERPINAGLAKVGSVLNATADVIGGNPTSANTASATQTTPNTITTRPASAVDLTLNNLLGTTIGLNQGQEAMAEAAKTREFSNLENQLADTIAKAQTDSKAYQERLFPSTNTNSALAQSQSQLTNIANAMNSALAAGDITSYSKLADLYNTAYNVYQTQAKMLNGGTSSDLNTSEKNQLAKLQSAGTALDQLEELYNKAGGGQGPFVGNFQNWLGSMGWNSDVNAYNQLSQGLINQIGAAIGKTDALNTEGEVQRALSLVPKITDDAQTAKIKLATLRSLLQTNTGTYNELYGA